MRVAKTADERRHEILDAAEKLFSTKGFDATSTNDILEEVGIARELYIIILNQKKLLWMP